MKGFYIQISNGLLLDGHRKRMGTAIWEFMWLLDHITSVSEDGLGKVMSGRPIRLKEITNNEVREATVSENITKLEKEGYINVIRAPYGLIISVNNAQKVFGQRTKENSENRKSERIRKTVNQDSENRKSIYKLQDTVLQDNSPSNDGGPKTSSKEEYITNNEPPLEQTAPASPPKGGMMRDTNLNSFSHRVNENGRKAVKLDKVQKEIVELIAEYPEIKQIRAEYMKIMEIEGEDGGSERANLKAWIELYTKKFKKDKNKLIEFIKKIKMEDKFWSRNATSGKIILTNFERIKKGDTTFVEPEKDEEGEGYSEEQIFTALFEQSAKANGTTFEYEKAKEELEQKLVKKTREAGRSHPTSEDKEQYDNDLAKLKEELLYK